MGNGAPGPASKCRAYVPRSTAMVSATTTSCASRSNCHVPHSTACDQKAWYASRPTSGAALGGLEADGVWRIVWDAPVSVLPPGGGPEPE